MNKRLFIIVNPTQYLNAIEYINQQGCSEDHLVIITPYYSGIQAINKLGTSKFWTSVELLNTSQYKQHSSDYLFWKDSWKFLNRVYRDIKPQSIVVGNIIDGFIYPLILKEKRRLTEIVVLDDGTPTLGVLDKRINGGFYSAYNFRSWRIVLKYIVYLKFLPLLYCPPKKLTFFTLFNISGPRQDKLIVNRYDWIKSKIDNHEANCEALFIGSHLVDRGVVSKNDYLNSLLLIKSDLKSEGKEMIYVHHRGESLEMREAIAKICPTKDFDQPLEFYFLNHSKPEIIAGHFSSALFTLSRIYNSVSIRAYLFTENQILGSEYESKKYILQVQKKLEEDLNVDSRSLSDLESKASL